jgi:FkbM family methyltransferase
MPKKPVVVDAGANIGFISLVYLELGAHHVHAFEPSSGPFSILSKIKSTSVTPHNIALSNEEGSAELLVSSGHSQGSTLNKEMKEVFPLVYEQERFETVKTERLDSLYKYIDFLKIDVEGHELSVLQGAKKLFLEHKPKAVQVEIYPDFLDEVLEFMSPYYENVKKVHLLSGNEIECLDIGVEPDKKLLPSPPTYIFY